MELWRSFDFSDNLHDPQIYKHYLFGGATLPIAGII
jgi:hypothetical protein